MSSGSKVDLSNVRQLLKVYTEIKTNLSTVELRDSITKNLHKIAAFLKMAGMYVPRSKEISNGSLNRASWKIDHLLTTANYFQVVDEVGFQYGNLPDYKLHCPHRNGSRSSLTSSSMSLTSMMTPSMLGMTTSHHFRPSSTMR